MSSRRDGRDAGDVGAAGPQAKRPRKVCSYGDNCYRRNPAHLREFSHPHLESILDTYSGTGAYPIPDNLLIQRHMIEEQLQIIIEKNIYAPGKRDNVPASKKASKDNIICTISDTSNSTVKDISITIPSDDNISLSDKNTSVSDSITNVNSPLSRNLKKESKESNNTPGTCGFNSEVNVTVKKDISANTEGSSRNVKKAEEKKMDSEKHPSSSSNSETSVYHPIVEPTRSEAEFFKVVLPKGRMLEKHRRSAPYHIFYTTITDARDTHKQSNSVTFQELLDRSLGELKMSLQLNFMVDLGWLLAQYYFAGYSQKPLTILYGEDSPDLRTINQKHRNVEAEMVNMATPFGTHHTKMMLLCYEDGSMRVVVSTANLYIDDWENRTQGLWMSPACPELPDGAMPHEGDSPTGFKKSLLCYLDHYRKRVLTHYIHRVKRCDFSKINVFLVASVPGGHNDHSWGMTRVGSLLSQHCRIPPQEKHKWEFIAQASSIGSFGNNPKLWLTGDFQNRFCRVQNDSPLLPFGQPQLRLIYPSLENVRQSHDNLLGGGCLPYSATAHAKQPWLKEFLHQWKAVQSGRNQAMPHIKSYLRVSPDYKMAAYYLLTSANISKAAWGSVNKGNGWLRIMSYEAGVLFLPSFVINEGLFPLDSSDRRHLPVPYDLPPTLYTSCMSPWVMDYLRQ